MDDRGMHNFKIEFEQEVTRLMRDYKIPGMSIYITKDFEPVYTRAFGLREKTVAKPATIDTLYGISSISKSFTCMAILQLHQQSKLQITEPVSKYIPFELGFEDDPITIQHLMAHASGIPSLHIFEFSQMNQDLYKGNFPIYPLGNWDDFYSHMNNAKSEILSRPNKKYRYSNGGFTLLGQIIEKVSGTSFEEYIKGNILMPLKMNRSSLHYPEAKNDSDITTGYNYEALEKSFTRSPRDLLSGPFISASGGIISSTVELTNYLYCFLQQGEFEGNNLLNVELLNEMWKPHNQNIKSKSNEYCPNADVSYGYGWKIFENYFGYTLLTHQGVSGVTGGNVAIIPELKITFAQLYNISWLPTALMHTALVLLLDKDPQTEMPFHRRRKHYEALCGTYEAYKRIVTLEIFEQNGLLYLKDKNWYDTEILPLIPKSDDPETLNFYIITPFGSIDINFTIHEDNQTTFDYERYLLHKR
ncbi:MAG: serine hydrolase [Candidatus Heimdallarchaeota archaeon]|nr:serine hydrolase [Candidatus Heimdallarchaeota archaeon]